METQEENMATKIKLEEVIDINDKVMSEEMEEELSNKKGEEHE